MLSCDEKMIWFTVDQKDHNVLQVSFTSIYLIESESDIVNKYQATFSGWGRGELNSQLHVDSILHLIWLFQVRRLGWVWADTPLDRWARTCPRSTLSWWPRTTCSKKPWLQTKGQSYIACYSICRVIHFC